jgi:hypothetical protein
MKNKTSVWWSVFLIISIIFLSGLRAQEVEATPTSAGGGGGVGGGGGGGGGGSSVYESLPIQSPEVLRHYGMDHVSSGAISIWSESMDWDYGKRAETVSGSCGEEVLAKLAKVALNFRVKNPNDPIYGWVSLRGVGGWEFFRGSARFTIADLAAGKKPVYEIWQLSLPLLSNVEAAEILAVGEDGETARRYGVRVEKGQILFEPFWAGAPNGLLSVKFTDGSVLVYSLAKAIGATPPPESVEDTEMRVQGHYIFKDPTTPISIHAVWWRPSVFVEITEAASAFEFNGVDGLVQEGGTPYFERPLGVIITTVNASGETLLGRVSWPQSGRLPVSPRPGKYRIWFEWDQFGQPGNLYTGPDSGGKG